VCGMRLNNGVIYRLGMKFDFFRIFFQVVLEL
jgi:hypothetical protein